MICRPMINGRPGLANSKAKSAFNKSLKAAGIDPKTVNIDDSGKAVMAQGAAAVVPAPAAAPAPAATEVPVCGSSC